MKKRLALVALLIVIAAAGFIAHGARAVPLAASSCTNWGNQTSQRVNQARQLIEPAELGGKSTGSAQGDAQALVQLANNQAGTSPPSSGQKLNSDLVEGFSAGANALAGTGDPNAQMALAKAIVYNADVRLAYLLDHC